MTIPGVNKRRVKRTEKLKRFKLGYIFEINFSIERVFRVDTLKMLGYER